MSAFSRHAAVVAVIWILPSVAFAHTGSGTGGGLAEGFCHPLLGWDHLLAMLLVGVWTAQQRARSAWAIPVAFLAFMVVGGLLAARGGALPAVEPVIAVSVLMLCVLIGVRARPPIAVAVAISSFFALFHGFAHGSETPSAASLASFGAGFLAATALLHGAGWFASRVAAVVFASLWTAPTAFAQSETAVDAQTAPSAENSIEIEEIVVTGRASSLIGVADSASRGTVGAVQLELRPTLRIAEILETVPGLIVTQHSGAGKANQYFLRGFNLDHGTDFATDLEGMPINLVSHGHGQGWTDLNIIIPELVERIDYQKGVYYADVGDLSSAGTADLSLIRTLDQTLVHVEGGSFGDARVMLATSLPIAGGDLLYGVEVAHYDGPWDRGDDYLKITGLLRYSRGDDERGQSLTAFGYHGGDWNSTDQIARSAVNSIGRFGSLDESDGGHSQRYGLIGEWHRASEQSATRAIVYGSYYDLDLYSNFTYFLIDPVRGDQFEQVDRRWTIGSKVSHAWVAEFLGFDLKTTIGLQIRNDLIHNGLYNTQERDRVAKIGRDGNSLPARVRDDRILETSISPYFEAEVQWNEWLRSIAGVRVDYFRFEVDDERGLNSGVRDDAIASPKLTLAFGPWADTEFYLQGGFGFHSNDARGVNTRIDPVTGEAVTPADPLVRTVGTEAGVRTNWLRGLHSTISAWWLDIDSELIFVGDAGTTEAGRPSRRYGLEFANYYSPTDWLTFDADIAISHTRFRDNAPEGRYIPGSIESVAAAGVTVSNWHGFFGSVRVRYFGPRPLTEDDSVRSGSTTLLNAEVGFEVNDHWRFRVEAFNLLNRKDSDIDYFYESAISPSAPIREQIHFHPVEPISARAVLEVRF